VGSSGAGQFQKGDRPKSINKSPIEKKRKTKCQYQNNAAFLKNVVV
jgi:hypothetical protein